MSELLRPGYIESVRKEIQSWTRNPSPYSSGTANDIMLMRDAWGTARSIASGLLSHIDSIEERNRTEVERIKADRDALRDELEMYKDALPKERCGVGGGRTVRMTATPHGDRIFDLDHRTQSLGIEMTELKLRTSELSKAISDINGRLAGNR